MSAHSSTARNLFAATIRLGLVGGIVSVFIALIGMLETFSKRQIISGALDMMRALGFVCKLDGVTREQAKDAVLKYLEEHPEQTKVAVVLQIIPAVEAAFDCKAPAALQSR